MVLQCITCPNCKETDPGKHGKFFCHQNGIDLPAQLVKGSELKQSESTIQENGGDSGIEETGEEPPIPTQTLVFVDVDGVLNVGIRDPDVGVVSFNEQNLQRALKVLRENRHDKCARRFVSVYKRSLGVGEENSTYAKLLDVEAVEVASVFASRLAQLVRAAGDHRHVVLTSYWRWPKYKDHVLRLEEVVSKHLGEPFRFDSRTALREDTTPVKRLQLIGDYLAQYCEDSIEKAKTRVLVLDDLNISPISCLKGHHSAERYLRKRVPASTDLDVRLIHTFEEWTTSEDLHIQVGSGLSLAHMCQALAFLGESSSSSPLCVDAARIGSGFSYVGKPRPPPYYLTAAELLEEPPPAPPPPVENVLTDDGAHHKGDAKPRRKRNNGTATQAVMSSNASVGDACEPPSLKNGKSDSASRAKNLVASPPEKTQTRAKANALQSDSNASRPPVR